MALNIFIPEVVGVGETVVVGVDVVDPVPRDSIVGIT